VSQDDIQEAPGSANPHEASAPAPEVGGETTTTVTPIPASPAAAPEADPDDTVGTGTSIALGCIAGTLLLIVIGLIFVGILAIL
jgi:predicted lipid-binding transport protein (Tim44 family)